MFRALCLDANSNEKDLKDKWKKVEEEIKKEKHVSPLTMGDLCKDSGSQKHAI